MPLLQRRNAVHTYFPLKRCILGLLLNDVIDNLLERVDIVAYTLIAGGVLFLFIDNLFKETEENGTSEISYPSALKIGFFQTISLIPGVSRSAATIIGGLTQKLNKKAAAEFSFFLAVPTMFAATAYKLLQFIKEEIALAPTNSLCSQLATWLLLL